MKLPVFLASLPAMRLASIASAAEPPSGSPAEHLPPHIRQVSAFGERADWSHDGRKILFLTKTFGDAMELDLETKAVRNLTAHYPHYGYTRALYLANDDILLSGPESFDQKNPGPARAQCLLYAGGGRSWDFRVRYREGSQSQVRVKAPDEESAPDFGAAFGCSPRFLA